MSHKFNHNADKCQYPYHLMFLSEHTSG